MTEHDTVDSIAAMELLINAVQVRQFLAYLDHVGLDPRELRVGYIDPKIRTSTQPMQVPARMILDLMEAAAETTERPQFALEFVDWLNPRALGTLSLLWENCTSLAERYRIESQYMHLEHGAMLYELAAEGDEIGFVCDVVPVLRPHAMQFLNAFVALNLKISRLLMGATWDPVRIDLPGTGPRSLRRSFQRFLRCEIRFGADRHALVVTKDDFSRRLPTAKPELVSFIEAHLKERASASPREIEAQVARLISAALPGRAPTLEQIAYQLGMTPRTLQRRLKERRTTFGAILRHVRLELVEGHLARGARPSLARLAYDLGYSEPSAVSRFLRSSLQGHAIAPQLGAVVTRGEAGPSSL